MKPSPVAKYVGAIPNRLQLAGGWIDQPFVSQYNPKPPGSMVVVQIEPGFRPMDRSGIASGTRAIALKLWRGHVPKNRPLAELVRELYAAENQGKSSFFAPHDTLGLIGLYHSKDDFEQHLDSLFSIPWNTNYIADNINCFIGQYCQGNQPDHGFAYLYYFIGKQEKSQVILNEIMDRFYGMEHDGLALCGMDDAGEMSAWYVFNAIGFYPYSPADPQYIVSVPLFPKVELALNHHKTFTILKENSGVKINDIIVASHKLDGYFLPHAKLAEGGKMVITTE